MIGPKSPDYVLSSTEAGFVYYEDQKAAGFQFVDHEGKQIFVSLPGKLIAAYRANLDEMLGKHPEIADCVPIDMQPKQTH